MKSERIPLIGMKIADMSTMSDDGVVVPITPEEYVAGDPEFMPRREIKVVTDGATSLLGKVDVPTRIKPPGTRTRQGGPGPGGLFHPYCDRSPFFIGRLRNKPGWLELNTRNPKIARYYVPGTCGKGLDHLITLYWHLDGLAKSIKEGLNMGKFSWTRVEIPNCDEKYDDDNGLDYLLNKALKRELDESPLIKELTDKLDRLQS